MKKTISNATAFAAKKTDETATVTETATVNTKERIAPIFTAVRTDIPVPVSTRPSRSEITTRINELTVNGSFGLTNKTRAQLAPLISRVNTVASNQTPKLDANGAPIVTGGDEIKDQAGNVVGRSPVVPVTEQIKQFAAYDVDPSTDPDAATVRIFRLK